MPPLLLFSAGFGTRMAPLTKTRPKPLVEVAGMPLIGHALSVARAAGITRIVANTHYLHDQMAVYLEAEGVLISHETPDILDTGGGLRAALPFMGDDLPEAVLTMNTDAIWTGANPIAALLAEWRPDEMDALLMCVDPARATGHLGRGDFTRDVAGRLSRGPGLVYGGVQIIKPERLFDIPEQAFSLNRLWDGILAEGRAYGALHDGGWCDVGQPESIALAEALLEGARDV